MKKSLTKEERLRKRADIQGVFSCGKSLSCKGLKLLHDENGLQISRVVFSPSRFPSAVERNAVKRRGREIYRNIKYKIIPGNDIVFVFYPGDYTFQQRQEQIISTLMQAHLL